MWFGAVRFGRQVWACLGGAAFGWSGLGMVRQVRLGRERLGELRHVRFWQVRQGVLWHIGVS